ncbi:MAG: ABC transporter substrate-binding protein [Limisphaerales bacterium]|nr:MAG: ABC transporter substrate-binding protein [Limisphaerales bacterium]TXT43813.1 MAG: ABC transporter substrate-binding protein [Limisphaerales bacterium]
MKNTSLETKLGMFVALVVVAAVVLLEMAGGTDFFKKGYRLHGLFNTAQELKVGDSVKMAGVPIGKVEKIGFEAGKVKVTMKVTEGADVKTDAKATIRFAGLMGQNFVSINLGTPTVPNLAPDSVIQTVEQPDLSAMMQKLDNAAAGIENLTKSFSGDSIQNVLGPMTDFLKNNNPKLTALFGNLQTISDRIAKGEGSIGKLLSDESLYNETVGTMKALNKTATDAQGLLADAKGAVGDLKGTFTDARGFIAEAKGSLGDVKLALGDARKTLNTATDTMTTAKQTLTDVRADLQAGKGSLGKLLKDEALYNETTLAMTNLREIMQKINRGQGSVGKFVNDESLFKNAKMTLQKLDKATEGLEDQGPLSVLGIAVNSLF